MHDKYSFDTPLIVIAAGYLMTGILNQNGTDITPLPTQLGRVSKAIKNLLFILVLARTLSIAQQFQFVCPCGLPAGAAAQVPAQPWSRACGDFFIAKLTMAQAIVSKYEPFRFLLLAFA